jgi:ABC-type lipoprotein export system ATPase subunit
MVTHDIHAAARASRTLYLNKGRLTAEPEEFTLQTAAQSPAPTPA